MKPLSAKMLAVILILGVGPPLATAGINFGDFAVTDSAIDTGITMFDVVQNPPPFPPSSAILQANTYPVSGSITVAQIWLFLASQGLPANTFGFCWEVGPYGTVGIASLVITIGGQPAAVSDGQFVIQSFQAVNTKTYFLPHDLYSDGCRPTDEVLFSYDTFTSTEDIVKIDLAAAPEPVSLIFLGTGFVATMLVRLKRRRK